MVLAGSLQSLRGSGLLGKLWPGTHVITALGVCKWIQEELLQGAGNVAFSVSPHATPKALAGLSTLICHFQERKLTLRCKGRHLASHLLRALADAECGVAKDGSTKEKGVIHLEMKDARINPSSNASLLALVLEQNKALRHLDLGGSLLRPQGIQQILPMLSGCKALRHLNLFANLLLDEGAASLSEALSRWPGLRHLGLRRNKLGAAGAQQVVSALRGSGIEELDVGCNALGQEGAARLARGLGGCGGLRELSMDGNRLGDGGVSALAAKALPRLPRLQRLHLFDTGLAFRGAAALAAALPLLAELSLLSLGHNALGPDGARDLAAALPRCRALHTLYLDGNGIGDQGAASVAGALAGCVQLQRLNLRRNGIRADGAGAVGEAMAGEHGVQELELGDNMLGDEGAAQLGAAAGGAGWRRVTVLGLCGNGIREKGRERLRPLRARVAGPDAIKLES